MLRDNVQTLDKGTELPVVNLKLFEEVNYFQGFKILFYIHLLTLQCALAYHKLIFKLITLCHKILIQTTQYINLSVSKMYLILITLILNKSG